MTTHIALLRGINVGGRRQIKMEALKALFETLGFSQVRTYIQSGNVVFLALESDGQSLQSTIETNILQTFGFDVTVMLRSLAEWRQIVQRNPYQSAATADGKKVHAVFLSQQPNPDLVEQLSAVDTGDDQFVVDGRLMYLHCPNGYGQTRLSNPFIERKLKVAATTRNWHSVIALLEMAG